MKNLFLGLFLLIILASCSGDDGATIENKLTIGDGVYSLQSLQIRNENGDFPIEPAADIEFALSNKTFADIDAGGDLSDILDVYFDFRELELKEGDYTAILDYNIYVGGTIVNGEYTRGIEIINDRTEGSRLQSAEVSISNLSESSMLLKFTFIREDGLKIEGIYEGPFKEL